MPARLERGGSQEDEQIKDLGGNEDNEREQKMGEGGGGSPAFAGCNQLPRGQLVTESQQKTKYTVGGRKVESWKEPFTYNICSKF